jgi:hypothetical protein
MAINGATTWLPPYLSYLAKAYAELGRFEEARRVATSVKAVMQPAGPEKAMGIISAGFVKDPTDPQWQDTPEYKEWLTWMKKYNTSVTRGAGSSNGSSHGSAVIDGWQKTSRPPSTPRAPSSTPHPSCCSCVGSLALHDFRNRL